MVSKIAENLDPQGCMELGAAVILGKPILVVAQDDSDVSDQLRAAAALIVIGSPTDGELKQKIVDAVESLIART
jgi:hypothetical protein